MTTSGTVWSSRPEISSSGPRVSLSVATLASECSEKLAAAAWNSGLAGDGIVHFSHSSSDSSSDSALPKPYRNSYLVSETALCRLVGLPRPGKTGAQLGQRQWQDALDLRRVDRNARGAVTLTQQPLGEQTAEGVADDDRRRVQLVG